MAKRAATPASGFALIEVILATAIFGFLVTALIGAIVFGRQSVQESGDRVRASQLSDEGIQAARNIRNANYANLVDGTYGLSNATNVWSLSGSSDTTGMYTRQVTVAPAGVNRKLITSTVSWQQANGVTRQVVATTRLSNWLANITKVWSNPLLAGSYDVAGTNDATKVATQGNYAYYIRNTGTPNFFIMNIATPSAPTLVGSLTLAGNPTNITVNGNYAYVSNQSDTAELQIVNITNPAAPTFTSSFNAAGAGDGLGVYYSNGYVYLSRAANGANDEMVIVNVAAPATPTRTYGLSVNVSMNEVYVNSGTIYVATNSPTSEVIAFTPVVFGAVYTQVSLDLPGTAAATTIAGNGQALIVGQGSTFYTVGGGLLAGLLQGVLGSVTLPGTINDIDINLSGGYAYAGTNSTTGEFQVINIATFTAPTVAAGLDIPGTTSALNGVAYNATLDEVPGASSSDTQEAVVFVPN